MSLEKLRAELSDLEEVKGDEVQRNISEGKMHNGPSAVVQFVGRKN